MYYDRENVYKDTEANNRKMESKEEYGGNLRIRYDCFISF